MKLFVANIQFDTTEAQLKAHFEQVGKVHKATLVFDRVTGKPRGFGFVEMDNAGGQAAIHDLHESELFGRQLRIEEAKERARN